MCSATNIGMTKQRLLYTFKTQNIQYRSVKNFFNRMTYYDK